MGIARRAATATAAVVLSVSGLAAIAPPSHAAACGDGTLTFSGGEGTASSPFLIRTEADLQALHDHYPLNSNLDPGYYGCSYRQVADIAMTSIWDHGIGFTTQGPAIWASWHGVYDGDGYAVANLRIDASGVLAAVQAHELGFIGHADTGAAVVRNVNLVDALVTCGSETEYAALLVGQTVGPVNRSSATGSIACAAADGLAYMGGLIGYTDAAVANAWVSGTIANPTTYSFVPNSVGGAVGKSGANSSITHVLARVAIVNPFDAIRQGAYSGYSSGSEAGSFAQSGLNDPLVPLFGAVVPAQAGGAAFRTALQLQDITTFAGWSISPGVDYSVIWGIDPAVNGGFPYLQPFYRPPLEGEVVPAPILQQVPLPDSGTCEGLDDAAFAFGTGLTGGWGRSWATWPNGGRGGPVCGRMLTYVHGRWQLAA